jgi:hypothetical protein
MQLLVHKRVISKIHIAQAPLFRNPITNGAADPVVIYKHETLIIRVLHDYAYQLFL